MGGFADIAGLGDAIKAITKLTTITERVINDAGLKEKFQDTGKIAGAFSLEGYRIKFEVEKEIKEIEAVEE